MTLLDENDARKTVRRIDAKETAAEAVVRACLERIEAREPSLS